MSNGFWSGAGGSLVGSALGFAGNMVTSAINSSRAWKYTQRAMNYQDELNRAYTRDSYGIMREGLKKAGYNPLLALGSGANSAIYSASAPNADSDNGSQAVASAIDATRLRNETKLNNANIRKIKAEEKGIELDNRKLESELNTSPRSLISDIITGSDSPTLKVVKNIANKLGVHVPNSANDSKKLIKIDLSDSKPYVQKGVPKEVVKSFNNIKSNSAVKSGKNFTYLENLNNIKDLIKHNSGKPVKYKKYNGSRGKVINLPNIT